jgi:hypothetical protein
MFGEERRVRKSSVYRLELVAYANSDECDGTKLDTVPLWRLRLFSQEMRTRPNFENTSEIEGGLETLGSRFRFAALVLLLMMQHSIALPAG